MTGNRKMSLGKEENAEVVEGGGKFRRVDDEFGQFAKFPFENPNPVFRVDVTGKILYANPASAPLFEAWQTDVEENIPKEWEEFIAKTIKTGIRVEREYQIRDRVLLMAFAPIKEAGYINIYGFDITERKQMEAILRESEEKYRTLVELADDAIILTDLQGNRLFANSKYYANFGHELEDNRSGGFDFVHPDDLPELTTRMSELLETGSLVTEYRVRYQDGSWGYRSAKSTLVRNENGDPTAILSVTRDVTKQKTMEQELRKNEARAQAMLSAVPDLIFRMDSEGVFLDYKAESKDLYFQTETILGKRNRDLVPLEFAELIERQIAIVLETRTLQSFEYQLDVPGRGLRDYEARMTASGEDEVIAIVRDVTDRKLAEMKLLEGNKLLEEQLGEINILQDVLREQVIRDSLTGLYNRRYLDETLDRELARAQREIYPVCVLMMDIDGFKGFNDTYGHKIGDKVLMMLGNLLHGHVRKGDIACRYGGDEFVLIFPRAHVKDAVQRAREIGVHFKSTDLQIESVQSNATLSVGVAAYPGHSEDGKELLRYADEALYRAKGAGRDLVYVWK